MPDMVESYLGATFVDSGFNFEVIETFFQKYIKPFFRDMWIYDTFANKHPTVRLTPTENHPTTANPFQRHIYITD